MNDQGRECLIGIILHPPPLPARPHHHLVTKICVTFIKTLKLYLEALELLCLFEGFNGKCHVQVCQQIPGGSRLRLSALVRLRAPGLGLSGQQL